MNESERATHQLTTTTTTTTSRQLWAQQSQGMRAHYGHQGARKGAGCRIIAPTTPTPTRLRQAGRRGRKKTGQVAPCSSYRLPHEKRPKGPETQNPFPAPEKPSQDSHKEKRDCLTAPSRMGGPLENPPLSSTALFLNQSAKRSAFRNPGNAVITGGIVLRITRCKANQPLVPRRGSWVAEALYRETRKSNFCFGGVVGYRRDKSYGSICPVTYRIIWPLLHSQCCSATEVRIGFRRRWQFNLIYLRYNLKHIFARDFFCRKPKEIIYK